MPVARPTSLRHAREIPHDPTTPCPLGRRRRDVWNATRTRIVEQAVMDSGLGAAVVDQIDAIQYLTQYSDVSNRAEPVAPGLHGCVRIVASDELADGRRFVVADGRNTKWPPNDRAALDGVMV